MLDSIISNRKTGNSLQQDFLESLIQKHSKYDSQGEGNNEKLTDTQLKDNILTLLIAGHDTTTAALTWLIKFLEENPDVLARLRVMVHILALVKFLFYEYCCWESDSKFAEGTHGYTR